MTTPGVEPTDIEAPSDDAAEQRAEADPEAAADLTPSELAEALESWDAEAIDPSDERVVALDDDDYR
jgi:hypothetical protein